MLCPRQRPTPYPQPGLGVYENTRLDSGNNRQVCIQRRTGCVGPRVRYNRLIDIFLGIACYSLQNHLRTTVRGMGQVETDEIYVGVDKGGSHYVVPVQAKGGNDSLNRVQIEQDIALCADKLPSLICRPVGTQLMQDDLIALFEFEQEEEDVKVVSEDSTTSWCPRMP